MVAMAITKRWAGYWMVQNELLVLMFVGRFSSVGVSLYCTTSALITVDTCSKSTLVSLIPNISATIFMNMALIWSSALAETKWLQKVIQHSMKEQTKFLHTRMHQLNFLQALLNLHVWTKSIYNVHAFTPWHFVLCGKLGMSFLPHCSHVFQVHCGSNQISSSSCQHIIQQTRNCNNQSAKLWTSPKSKLYVVCIKSK